jgi:hypothetical protein
MSAHIGFHDVATVEVEPVTTCREGQPDEFSSRTIRITFNDGTSQSIELYGKTKETMRVRIE